MASRLGKVTVGRLPNLVIAGVSKAGTTSLFHYLGQHPDVGTSDLKELRYFSPLRYGQALDHLDTYTAHFVGSEQHRYALEATPGYFYGGELLARGMNDTCPGVHVLVSFRSPVDRCWSWFGFVKSRLRIPREMTFESYLDRCEELYRDGVDGQVENQPYSGLGAGCYAQWLDAWKDEFEERLRIIFFDDLVADPRLLVTSVFEWLDLDTRPVDGFAFEIDNQTRQYRNKAIQNAAVRMNRHAERFFHNHQNTKRVLRRGYYSVNGARHAAPMLPATRARLFEFYEPHNARLAKQLEALGLTLPSSWSNAG